MANPFQGILDWVYNKFSKDPSKMLIWTGVAGWTISSLAQAGAILFNPKISSKDKSFLFPQEIADAAVNIASFFVLTQTAKSIATSLFETGKFAPKSVRNFLNENKHIYANKIGKLGFKLDDSLKNPELLNQYKTCKNLGTLVTTVGAGVVASNIVTPIIRNRMASGVQKTYMNQSQREYPVVRPSTYKSPGMKI